MPIQERLDRVGLPVMLPRGSDGKCTATAKALPFDRSPKPPSASAQQHGASYLSPTVEIRIAGSCAMLWSRKDGDDDAGRFITSTTGQGGRTKRRDVRRGWMTGS